MWGQIALIAACPDPLLSCVWSQSALSFFNFTLIHRDNSNLQQLWDHIQLHQPPSTLVSILRWSSREGEGFSSCRGILNQRQLCCAWTPHAFVQLRDTNVLMPVVKNSWVQGVRQHINLQLSAPGEAAFWSSSLSPVLHQNSSPQTVTVCTL